MTEALDQTDRTIDQATAAPTTLPVAGRRTTARYIADRLKKRRLALFGAIALFVVASGAGIVVPYAIGIVVDRVTQGAGADAITGPVVAIAFAALVQGILSMAAPAMAAEALEPTLSDLREDVVEHALHLPSDVVERSGTGDLVARVDGDVEAVGEAVRGAVPEMAASALTIGLSMVGIAALDWRLGLAALTAVPIQAWTLNWYLPRSNPVYRAEREASGARSEQVLESVAGADSVRAFGLRDQHMRLNEERSRTAVGLVVEATRLRTRFFARLNVAEAVGMVVILLVGFRLVDAGSASVGEVTAAVLFFQRVFDPVNALLFLADEAQSAAAALGRLVGVTLVPAAPRPATSSHSPADVVIRGLTYSYGSCRPVLHDVHLHIPAGQRVAVVGPSGAGKSTLAKVVAGVHPVSPGTVTVAGIDVERLSSVSGRPPVVLVTQEVHVHAGTVADGLRLAAPEASAVDLAEALDAVGASWCAALPDGIDTVVGAGGHPLTGAQAQQLALAAVILADPAVAVLDEATAEAGSTDAARLDEAAIAAVTGRTALVVAHRLSQAVTADRVLVIDDGRVVQDGRHDELVAGEGPYATLWATWAGHRVAPEGSQAP